MPKCRRRVLVLEGSAAKAEEQFSALGRRSEFVNDEAVFNVKYKGTIKLLCLAEEDSESLCHVQSFGQDC